VRPGLSLHTAGRTAHGEDVPIPQAFFGEKYRLGLSNRNVAAIVVQSRPNFAYVVPETSVAPHLRTERATEHEVLGKELGDCRLTSGIPDALVEIADEGRSSWNGNTVRGYNLSYQAGRSCAAARGHEATVGRWTGNHQRLGTEGVTGATRPTAVMQGVKLLALKPT